MKILAFGHIYDPETADIVSIRENEPGVSPYGFLREELCRNPDGKFFVVGYTAFDEPVITLFPTHPTYEQWIREIGHSAPTV